MFFTHWPMSWFAFAVLVLAAAGKGRQNYAPDDEWEDRSEEVLWSPEDEPH